MTPMRAAAAGGSALGWTQSLSAGAGAAAAMVPLMVMLLLVDGGGCMVVCLDLDCQHCRSDVLHLHPFAIYFVFCCRPHCSIEFGEMTH